MVTINAGQMGNRKVQVSSVMNILVKSSSGMARAITAPGGGRGGGGGGGGG